MDEIDLLRSIIGEIDNEYANTSCRENKKSPRQYMAGLMRCRDIVGNKLGKLLNGSAVTEAKDGQKFCAVCKYWSTCKITTPIHNCPDYYPDDKKIEERRRTKNG